MLIPSCTYRVQFNPRFTFNHLGELADYLEELGITCIYSSPILQPTRGSEHGYDGIDCTRLNPELGTEEELVALTDKLKAKGMGWIQDIVPNHLAFHTTNVWLRDVLERGMNSSYARHFDIDWEHPAYPHKLMVPFLDNTIEECLKQGTLKLGFKKEHGFGFEYYDNFYPLRLESYLMLLADCCHENAYKINAALGALINNMSVPYDQWTDLKKELLQVLNAAIDEHVTSKVTLLNEDHSTLQQLMRDQHYVLCHFTESHKQINYRRFFNVNGLICLRVEDEVVFNDYHRYIHQLYKKGIIHGLRVDHVDGLKNPHDYIRRLRALFGDDCYIIVEKILDVKEDLPSSMAIQGTSGYEFLSYINQVITDNKGSEKLLALYNELVPHFNDYSDIVFKNKLANFEMYLNGEWDNLLRYLLSLNLVDDGEIRLPNLKMAMGVFMAAFPVYRVYVENLPLDINDEQLVVNAFVQAHKRYPELSYELGVLRRLFEPHPDAVRNNHRLLFVQRLMQFTGPLAAKGVEDTTFYQYNPLISHNEVGDQPCVLGITVREFHEKMQLRQQRNALSFNCTSTHDTKRGEDNRIRINIISELTEEWTQLVAQWQTINQPFRKQVGDILAPIINDEYFLYQAIVGGYPEDLVLTEAFKARTKRYFIKMLRESNQVTDHIDPDFEYEKAFTDFIDHLLNPDHEFLPLLQPFVKKIIRYANTYTMTQVIIKTTAPGIPDIYQGCELWDLSYVDPDNRRPVDYELRKRLLSELKKKESESSDAMLKWANENFEVGTQKLMVTHKILQLRKKYKELFILGEYKPVYFEGSDREVISFFRQLNDQWILVVLPLGIVAHGKESLTLVLPPSAPRRWRNIFTGDEVTGDHIEVKEVFRKFPVAVLEGF